MTLLDSDQSLDEAEASTVRERWVLSLPADEPESELSVDRETPGERQSQFTAFLSGWSDHEIDVEVGQSVDREAVDTWFSLITKLGSNADL